MPHRSRLIRHVGFCFLFLISGACGDRAETQATPNVTAAKTSVPDSPASKDAEALAAALLPRLERLSGLKATRPLRIRSQTEAQIRAYVASRLEHEMPAAELAGIHDTYALLGLIPDTLDLHALLLDLYTEQIVGYYDATSQTMFVQAGADTAALRPVLAHELVHALQDAHVRVDSLIDADRGNDRSTAAHAALEGHATIVMFALMAEDAEGRALDPAKLPNPSAQLRSGLEMQNNQFPVFSRAPAIIRETLLFPYIGGADFVYSMWSSDTTPQHRAPLDGFLPQSTEQILHAASKFLVQRDTPTELRFSNALPAGWRLRREDTFGELETGILLEHYLGKAGRAAAQGWDGDVYRMLESTAGGRALVWYSVWDDAASADRFAAAMVRIKNARGSKRTMTVDRVVLQGIPAVRVIDAALLTAAPEVSAPTIYRQQ
jgi:hypothetical protein